MKSGVNLSRLSASARLSAGILSVLIVFAVSLNFYVTAQGVGASPDSAVYIGVANNLLSGSGFRIPFGDAVNTPLTQFPPLYSLMIGLAGLIHNDHQYSIRLLNLILLAGNLILFWLFAIKITSPNRIFASMLVAPLTAGISFLTIHIMAWSEALFIFLGFSGLYLIANASAERIDNRFLIGSLLLALSALTRYAGIAFVLTAALFLFLHPGIASFARRLWMAAGVCVIGLLLPLVWILFNQIAYDNAFNRTLSFHPIQMNAVNAAIQTFANWFFLAAEYPMSIKASIVFLLVVIAIGGLYILVKQSRISDWNIARLMIIFLVVYGLFLIFSISLVDANTPLDDRILSPVFFALWLLFGFLIHGYRRLLRSQLTSVASIVLLAYPMLSLASNSSTIQSAHQNGIGFFGKAWEQSETISWIKESNPHLTLFSNSPEGIYLNTGISALALPKKNDLMKNQPNSVYPQELRAIGERVSSGKAAIVYFTFLTSRNLPVPDELISVAPLAKKTILQDGVLVVSNLAP